MTKTNKNEVKKIYCSKFVGKFLNNLITNEMKLVKKHSKTVRKIIKRRK